MLYVVTRRTTVRARPSQKAQPLIRVDAGYRFPGRAVEGWVEQVRDGACAGYIRASHCQAVDP